MSKSLQSSHVKLISSYSSVLSMTSTFMICGLESIESSVKAFTQATEDCKDISGSISVRNPLKVPNGPRKRYGSIAERIMQGKRSCGKCKRSGHDKCSCPNKNIFNQRHCHLS